MLDPSRAVLLSPRVAPKGAPAWLASLSHAAAGHQVVMPLVRRDGSAVLAIVGWLPADAEAPAEWARGSARAPLRGVLRGSDAGAGGAWDGGAPAEPREAGPASLLRALPMFSFINVPALCAACGLRAERGDVTRAVLEVLAPFPARGEQPWPVTRQAEDLNTAYATPATHLSYAATWAMLAAYGAVSTLLRWRRRRGGGRGR
jgi:cytochrome oxidase assembly protein ShyY1